MDAVASAINMMDTPILAGILSAGARFAPGVAPADEWRRGKI